MSTDATASIPHPGLTATVNHTNEPSYGYLFEAAYPVYGAMSGSGLNAVASGDFSPGGYCQVLKFVKYSGTFNATGISYLLRIAATFGYPGYGSLGFCWGYFIEYSSDGGATWGYYVPLVFSNNGTDTITASCSEFGFTRYQDETDSTVYGERTVNTTVTISGNDCCDDSSSAQGG